jgi:iron complex transport system substrate-binding protein
VKQKPKVGGIHDINYEAVLAMRPALVILSHMQTDVKERLDALGVNSVLLDQSTFEGILNSLEILGEVLGAQEQAAALISDMKSSVDSVIQRIAFYKPKSAIFVVSRNTGGSVVVAGNDGYYSKILEMLNAENPFNKYAAYSTVSKEGLYWVNPEVTIELLYMPADKESNEICYITGSYGYTPGPRFPLLVETAAKCIYPEAFE